MSNPNPPADSAGGCLPTEGKVPEVPLLPPQAPADEGQVGGRAAAEARPATGNGGASAARRRVLGWLAVLALLGYAALLARHTAVVAGGADSSGYLNSARLFAAGQLAMELRLPPEMGALHPRPGHFIPAGFIYSREHARLLPTYPTGLPLHFAVAGKLFGWKTGPLLVLLGAAAGAVGLCYLAARQLGLGVPLAIGGAVMLAVFPVFVFTSIQPLSDTLATTWALAALCAALRARTRPTWAAGAGLALAVAVLVRPTNALLAPALLVLFGVDWRRLGLFALGGVPGAAWFALYNHTLYGHPLKSGYGDIFAAFAVAHGGPTALHFAKWLALLLPSVLLVLPFAALSRPAASAAAPCNRHRGNSVAAEACPPSGVACPPSGEACPPSGVARPPWRATRQTNPAHRSSRLLTSAAAFNCIVTAKREWLALVLAFAAITGCYAFYEVSHEVWWCLRFILPAVPALILAALLGVEALAAGPLRRWSRGFRPAAALVLSLWALGAATYWAPRLGVWHVREWEEAYAEASLAARDRLPPGALVTSLFFSGALYFYTDFPVLRWDQLESSDFARYATAAHQAGRPVCAVLFDAEAGDAFRRCPGNWTRLAQVRNVGLWQLDASGP